MVDGKERLDALNNFKFENIENANNDIGIGNTCSSSVSFSIYMPPVSLENKEITIYEGLKIGNNIEYIKLGIFIITKQESDGEYTKYTGYDRMYNLEMGYFSELSFPSTDKAILEEICSQIGIEFSTNITEPNAINEKPNGYTRREIVGYMAALQGKNAVINADGNLELRWYSNTDYKLDGNKYYEAGVTFTTSKNFIIQKLTCNNSSGNGEENTTITSGSGTTGITFSNPFMTQEILDKVYEKIGGFTFRPLSVKFVGDFRLDVGDIITVSKGNVDYNVPIMQITHECDGGLISTVKSVGQSDSSNSNVSQGPLTKQMQRYYAELVIVNQALVNKLDVETAKITYATITELKAIDATVENLKATALTADMADLKYAKIDLTNIEAGSIKTAMIETGAIGTAQIADGSITDAKIVGVTANKITAGTIDAAQIEVVNLNAANITVGSINGVQIASGAIDMSKLGSDVSEWISTTESSVDKALKDAGLASSNASSAVTAADSAVSIANGKNTSYYQKTAPSGGTYKVNDIWFDTDDGYKMYYWNGSAWSAAQYGSSAISANAIAADKIASGAVTEVKISNGAVTADKIRSNSILARHLVITDFENYCTTDENYPDTDNSSSTAIVDGYVTKEDASVEYMALNNFVPIPFTEETTEIFFEAYVKGTNGSKIQGAVALYDDANKTLAVYGTEIFNVTETLAKVSGTIKVKKVDNAVTFRVLVHDTSTIKAQLYLQKIKFYKKTGTTLISDGAITTDKISANAVTANNIAASAVTAGKIAAGAVTANNIAANAVTAGKIAANAVTTSTIAAGAITTAKIAASAVTAAKIAIADYTNYATINELIPSSAIAGRALISDGYMIKTTAGASAMMLCDYTPLSLVLNDEIHYEFTIKGASAGQIYASIWFYDSSKQYLSGRGSSAYTITTEEQEISGTIKLLSIPATATYFIVGITDGTAIKIQLYVKKAKFIRKSGTTLISDGAITTDKIVAQAVTGAKIAASTITANNIAANAVTADKINVSSLSAISANLGTITAGVIQSTNYAANRTGMKLNLATGAWDSKYFKINSAGEITASAGTIGGWNITDNSLYGDYDAYRSYIQTAKSADTWVFSAQEKRDGTYYGNWYVTADGRMYSKNKVVIDSSGKDTGSYILMETWGASGDKHQTKTNGLEYRAHNLTNNNYAKLQASGLWFGNDAESTTRGSITKDSNNRMCTSFHQYETKNENGVFKGMFSDKELIMFDGWNKVAIHADWNGNLKCSGTKNRIVETENFGTVAMNAFETAGAHFADIASGKIAADGKCVIYLDRKFAETIDRDCEYQVILTAVGKASELYVIKNEEYFTVYGQPETDFDCMIIGRQKGYVTSYADSVDFSGLGEEVSENVIN